MPLPARTDRRGAWRRTRPAPRIGWRAAVAALAATVLSGPSLAHPYRIDPTHTTVHWEVLHMGTSTSRGRFDALQGEASFEPGRQLQVAIDVRTDSVSTGIAVFDRVLRGSSLLASEAHPVARFRSEGVRWSADGLAPAEVNGQLELKGRRQPLVLQAERWRCGNNPLFGREVCGGDFLARVSRSAFGMGFAGAMADDTVTLRIQVEAIRSEPGDPPIAGPQATGATAPGDSR